MTFLLEHCEDVSCGRNFEVKRFSKAFATAEAKPGVIRCPYCGTSKQGAARSVYVSNPVNWIYTDWFEVADDTSQPMRLPAKGRRMRPRTGKNPRAIVRREQGGITTID